VTLRERVTSVATLFALSQQDCGGGSSAAAQLLLSTYNGDVWQLDITDLCRLSEEYYAAAIAVIAEGQVEY